jgi:hypothetical protein
LRFQRGKLADFTGTVSTREPHTVLSPYPKPGQRGVFDRGRVRIETDDGDVRSERENPRAAIRRLRRNLWWDDLDLLYVAGYALWNYMCAPFMLAWPGFELTEREPWEEDGERWDRLHVVFPDDISTHSREQDFYFDEKGLLRRLDYTAEVFGSWAKAAHYCWDHEQFSGLIVPTRRKAMPRARNGKPRRGANIVSIRLGEVALVG